jgi:cellulose synthase/poly-beta-1,6-N-acetylglucosamine synthase-like glycosyltransferase
LVIDGGSSDDTRARAATFVDRLDLRIVDNPDRVQSLGCNRAADVAQGDILCRVDGHTTYAPDYLSACVAALASSDAVAVGGRQVPASEAPWGRAAALAMTSWLATGPSAFRHATTARDVDTVYLGAFARQDFLDAGGYRHFPSGVAEEADLYWRWRRQGRRIRLDPSIRSVYRPRETLGAWIRQNFRYGAGKAEFLYANRTLPSWRPLAPVAALFVGLIVVATGVVAGMLWPVVVLAGLGLAAVLAAVIPRSGSVSEAVRGAVAIVLMPSAYAIGFLAGLGRGPAAVRTSLPAIS